MTRSPVVVTSLMPGAVRAWCLRHPEVAQTLTLVSGETTMDTPHIACDPGLGISAGDALSALRDWLVGER